jgi:hypothetical protein
MKKLITVLAFALITCALTAEQQSDDAALANRLEKGKLYSHWGVVLQVMEQGLLMDDGKPREVGVEATAPWAFLVFEDPKAMESVSLQPGEWIAAKVRFDSFKNFPMKSGAERRLAVFTCFGFTPHGKSYVRTSTGKQANPEEFGAASARRQANPGATVSGPSSVGGALHLRGQN